MSFDKLFEIYRSRVTKEKDWPKLNEKDEKHNSSFIDDMYKYYKESFSKTKFTWVLAKYKIKVVGVSNDDISNCDFYFDFLVLIDSYKFIFDEPEKPVIRWTSSELRELFSVPPEEFKAQDMPNSVLFTFMVLGVNIFDYNKLSSYHHEGYLRIENKLDFKELFAIKDIKSDFLSYDLYIEYPYIYKLLEKYKFNFTNYQAIYNEIGVVVPKKYKDKGIVYLFINIEDYNTMLSMRSTNEHPPIRDYLKDYRYYTDQEIITAFKIKRWKNRRQLIEACRR